MFFLSWKCYKMFLSFISQKIVLSRGRENHLLCSMLSFQCCVISAWKKNILTWLFDLLCPSEYLCIIVCVLTNEMRSHSRLTHKPPRRSILSDTCIHSLTFVEHKLNASRFSITGNTERTKFRFSCINSKWNCRGKLDPWMFSAVILHDVQVLMGTLES